MSNSYRWIGLLATAALATAGLARADDPPPPMDVWTGKGALGAVIARGNSVATTLNAAVDAQELTGNWKHQLGMSALKADTSNTTSANRWELHGQTNYKFDDRSYVFGALRYDSDHFSAFDHQATASGGYGYQWLNSAATKLNTEIGVGYRQAKIKLTGENESDAILRGGLNFEHSFNGATKIYDKLLIESGKNDTFTSNDVGLVVKMSDKLALSLDYQVRNHSKTPDPKVKKTDELVTAAIVFSF